jgi:O-methyltransferase domain
MTDTVTADPVREIVQLANLVAASHALHVVADFGIADAIGPDEEVAVGELADRCGCHPDALHRVLRLLEIHGVFHSEQRCWSHTPLSAVLRSDHPTSVRAYARLIGLPGWWDALGELNSTLRTGRPAPVLDDVGGTFAYLAVHPEQLAVFDDAMTAKAHADIAGILAQVDFSGYATVADIGGGRGHLLRAITASCPETTGILFDLPHVLEHVEPDLTGRISYHAGDFFAGELPAADLSILMQVIHDWNDDDARRILSAIAATATPDSALMLFEWLLPENPTDDATNVLDLFMLSVTGGRERTATEYTALLDHTGFDVVSIRQVVGPMFIIEARLRSR